MALSSWKRLHPHFPLLLALLPSTTQSGKKKSESLNSKPKCTNSMAFWKRQNSGHSQKINGCQELVGRMNEWMEHRGFSGSEATVCCCSVTKSHPILCNSMDCNPPGSSVLLYLLSLLKFMSIELVILSNHLILCVVPNGSYMSL